MKQEQTTAYGRFLANFKKEEERITNIITNKMLKQTLLMLFLVFVLIGISSSFVSAEWAGGDPGAGGDGGDGGGGGGGGGGGPVTHLLGNLTGVEITKSMSAKDKFQFNLEGVKYGGSVLNVTETSAKLNVSDIVFTLNVDETKKIDLDADGVYYDISIMLVSIAESKAKLAFKAISEVIPPGVEEEEEVPPEEEEEEEEGIAEEIIKKAKEIWLWVTIAAVVVIAIIIYLLIKKNREGALLAKHAKKE